MPAGRARERLALSDSMGWWGRAAHAQAEKLSVQNVIALFNHCIAMCTLCDPGPAAAHGAAAMGGRVLLELLFSSVTFFPLILAPRSHIIFTHLSLNLVFLCYRRYTKVLAASQDSLKKSFLVDTGIDCARCQRRLVGPMAVSIFQIGHSYSPFQPLRPPGSRLCAFATTLLVQPSCHAGSRCSNGGAVAAEPRLHWPVSCAHNTALRHVLQRSCAAVQSPGHGEGSLCGPAGHCPR